MKEIKPQKKGTIKEIIYDQLRWEILREKRKIAEEILSSLADGNLNGNTHGSLARGDVNEESDIDIYLTEYVPSYKVELLLEKRNYRIYKKEIIQATPKSSPKVYFYLDSKEKIVVSFPLAKLTKNEYEFYKFGGIANYEEILTNKRKKGVDKRLMLIVPTEKGHIEYSIIGREDEVAKELEISINTILERKNLLLRRDKIGRTGTFLKVEVYNNQTVEEAALKLISMNWMFKKVMMERGQIF
ncbi:MAG: nucleotidyltransferase domain-containing protein [Thermoproteota archaeon]|nr:nucleotidyltransferase domain-containing protein [Candidatus Brockarchaeota archaeon]